MTNLNITPELIEALWTLRVHVKYRSLSDSVKDAINTLDNAGVFAALDEASNYEATPVPKMVSRCDCTPTWVGHMPGCPGDPSEWGDTAYTAKEN